MPNLLDVGKAAASPVKAIMTGLDKLFTSKEEKLSKQEAIERLHTLSEQELREMQGEINKVEAGHRTIFVAGWRPATGWVCATALFYNFVLRDLLTWGLAVAAVDVAAPPALHMEQIMTVLTGMLGLGAYRSYEKAKGVSK